MSWVRSMMSLKFGAGFLGGLSLICVSCLNQPEDEPNSKIFINEFMVKNSPVSPFADCQGNHEDWVELYNPGPESVNMKNYYLSDVRDDLYKKRLHDTVIPAGGYYLLWSGDGVGCPHNNHLGFSFNSEDLTKKEMILLTGHGNTIIDSAVFLGNPEACAQDKSYGRNPDGSETWKQQGTATPGATNGARD